MPTTKTALKSFLSALLVALCATPTAAQQQPAPGEPGYVRVQGQDGAAPALPLINTQRALIDHREEMRTFIQRISTYARQQKRNFMVVARDAEELIIKRDLQDENIISPARTFTRSVDAVMYDGVFLGHKAVGQAPPAALQQQVLANIERAKRAGLPVLTVDFATEPKSIDAVYRAARQRGLIPFVAPRSTSDLPDLPRYPRRPNGENSNNVLAMSDVKNFVYLSDPAAFGRQDQFALKIHDTNYDLVIVDPFSGRDPLNKSAVETLKYKKLGARRLVFARMDIGTAASYRYYWQEGWGEGSPGFIAEPFPGDPDRYFVEYWNPGWQQIMSGNPQSFLYGLINQGYDGVLLEGMRNYLVFEGNVEVDQAFAPLATATN
jgi:endo-alpha-1,4-polygalactosaminidase (GH114 family)